MGIYTKKKISPKGKLNKEDLSKLGLNIIVFTAPALSVLFYQLSQGAEFKVALPLALFVLYQLLADFTKKLSSSR